MSTDETLVQLDFDEDHEDLFIDRKTINIPTTNNSPSIHRGVTSITGTQQQQQPTVPQQQQQFHNHQLFHHSATSASANTAAATSSSSAGADSCRLLRTNDRRSSSISLSSSSDAEAVCLVPEVGFDNINLEGGDSRESQPLLGGRDQPDIVFNHFPGKQNTKTRQNVLRFVYVLLLAHNYERGRGEGVNHLRGFLMLL